MKLNETRKKFNISSPFKKEFLKNKGKIRNDNNNESKANVSALKKSCT
jgi:hypothetical protein